MTINESRSPDIVIFGHYEKKGGIQRFLTNIIKEWVAKGFYVEVVSYRNGGLFYPEELSKNVSFVDLGVHNKHLAVFKLWRYLIKAKPKVLLSTFHIDNKILSYLSYLPETGAKRFLVVQNNFVRSQKRKHGKLQHKLREVKKLYQRNDGIITASEGIKEDFENKLGMRDVPIRVVWNGAITQQTFERSKESVEHPWLKDTHRIPVVISVGGLRRQKDHKTLIDAIAKVRSKKECRLIILGEGPLRDDLIARSREKGIEDAFDLPGFQDNPYAWMARADCFALSSLWEGFAIVVAEALGMGLPVVSTDCPSGPSEILQSGRYGKLVPPDDSEALAKAILRTLEGDFENFDSKKAVQRFTAEYCSRRYLDVFGVVEKNFK